MENLPRPNIITAPSLLNPEKTEAIPLEVVDAKLNDLQKRFNIAPELTDALMTRNIPLRRSGLPVADSEVAMSAPAHINEVVENIIPRFEGLARLADGESDRTRPLHSKKNQKNQTTWRQTVIQSSDEVEKFRAQLREDCELGLERCKTAANAAHAIHFTHNPHDSPVDLELYAPDLIELYGEVPPRVSYVEIVNKLRELNRIDDSKKFLDKQFLNTLLTAQFETAHLFLCDLTYMLSMGGNKVDKALGVFKKYREKLFQNDLASKVEMMLDIGAAYRLYAASEPEKSVKSILQDLEKAARKVGEELQELPGFMRQVYANLGYELPSFLALPAEPEPVAPVEAAVEVAGPSPELIATIESAIAEFGMHAEAFLALVRRPVKGQKPADITKLRGELVRGCRFGDNIWDGVAKERAQELTTLLSCLAEISSAYKELKTARQALGTLLSTEEILASRQQTVQGFMNEHGLNELFRQAAWPQLFPFGERYEEIKSRWPFFKALIAEKWPNFDGATMAHSIEQLLFAPEKLETTEQPKKEAAQKAEIQATIETLVDGHLDEVLFPGDGDLSEVEIYVRKTLHERGVSQRQLELLQWKRILDLNTLKEVFDGRLYKTKAKEKFLGTDAPYFVVIFEYRGNTYVVAESPIFGNATYIVSEKYIEGSWLEVLTLPFRRDAKRAGAVTLNHTADAPYGDKHTDRVLEKVSWLDALISS